MSEPLHCRRCGDEDGPFVGTGEDTRCEPCARPVPLTQPIT